LIKKSRHFPFVGISLTLPLQSLPDKLGKASTCPTERRKTYREERDVAIMGVLAGGRV
jgi:hypothetical protein